MGLKEKLTRLREAALDHDPAARIAGWTADVSALYVDIENWLASYVRDGLMAPRREEVPVEESAVGPYRINRLVFDLPAGRALILDPVGVDVIGADGRVDLFMQGERSSGYVLLLNPHPVGAATKLLLGEDGTLYGWHLQRRQPTVPWGFPRDHLPVSAAHQRLTHESLESAIETLIG